MTFKEAEPIEANKPNVQPDLVKVYQAFQESFKPICDFIYYPCCGLDVTPSIAFPENRIIYLDIDEDIITVLREHGYEAYHHSAFLYEPEQEVDVLILLNPSISSDRLNQHVVEGGFILCNNYHGTARELFKNSDFQSTGFFGHIYADDIHVFQRIRKTPIDEEAQLLEDWEEAIKHNKIVDGEISQELLSELGASSLEELPEISLEELLDEPEEEKGK